jgi:hypothetical protein
MASENGDDRGIDGVVEGVRRAPVGEQDAEHGDEDRAASQQDTRTGTGGGGQQGPAGPRAFHEAPLRKVPSHYPGMALTVFIGRAGRDMCDPLGRDPRCGRVKWLHMPLIRLSRYASVGGADLRKEA